MFQFSKMKSRLRKKIFRLHKLLQVHIIDQSLLFTLQPDKRGFWITRIPNDHLDESLGSDNGTELNRGYADVYVDSDRGNDLNRGGDCDHARIGMPLLLLLLLPLIVVVGQKWE